MMRERFNGASSVRVLALQSSPSTETSERGGKQIDADKDKKPA